MKIETRLKYGDEGTPWKPNLLTAILQIVFAPLAFVVGLLFALLAVLYDFLTMGSQHLTIRAVPKKIQMPDGTIRDPNHA